MEKIILPDMDRLMSPMEQAKMMGLLKAPEKLKQEEKQKYLLWGISAACIFLVGCFTVQRIIEENNRKRKQAVLGYDSFKSRI